MATAPSPSCPRNAAPAPSAPLYDTMVTIKVGRQKQAFFAHKGLICNYSTYFKAAFHGQFREATAGAVELDNDDVEVFKTFFGWMYTGKLFEPSSEPGKVPLTANLLAKIYVFGDARGIPDLKNAAIDAFVDKIIDDWNNVPASTIPYIYDNTPEDSKLRKLLVDMVACSNYKIECLQQSNCRAHYTIDYLRDLSIRLHSFPATRPRRGRNSWRDIDRCQYHDHPDVAGASNAT